MNVIENITSLTNFEKFIKNNYSDDKNKTDELFKILCVLVLKNDGYEHIQLYNNEYGVDGEAYYDDNKNLFRCVYAKTKYTRIQISEFDALKNAIEEKHCSGTVMTNSIDLHYDIINGFNYFIRSEFKIKDIEFWKELQFEIKKII